MHQGKTVARILLIFSIANFVLAAPAIVRQRRFITDRSDEPTDESTPLLAPISDASDSSAESGLSSQARPQSPAVMQDLGPVSVASQLNDPASVSGASESHSVPPSMLGNPPSQDGLPPASEAAPIHKGPSSGTGAQPFFEDAHPSWHDFRPGTEIEEVAEPDVHDIHDVHNYQDDDYYDYDFGDDIKPNVDYDDYEVKPKGLCGLRVHCWDWDFSEVFSEFKDLKWDTGFTRWLRIRSSELSPERDHGHRFSWGVRLSSLSCRHLNHVTNILIYDLPQ